MQCAGTGRESTQSPLNLLGFVRIIGHYLLDLLIFLELPPLMFKVYVDTSCMSYEGLECVFQRHKPVGVFLGFCFCFFLRQYLYL